MVADGFPLGAGALHPLWPEARFNVSGMFAHHPLILHFIKVMEQAFGCHLPIEAIHGAPAVTWNAGRVSCAPLNMEELRSLLDFLYARNIGYFPTFTNHLLTQRDLEDPVCNSLLALLDQRPELNGVIVASELLSKYLAERYPRLRQVASIVKVTFDHARGCADYYAALGRRFYRYVVHPDDCRDLKLLEKLDRQKAEIIINENCVSNCPSRARHYQAYAQCQKAATPSEREVWKQELGRISSACRSPLDLDCLMEHRRNCNLSIDEMKAVYDMGFRHFKFQGRADNPLFYAFDLTRFMLEPQFAAPLVYKTLLRWLMQMLVPVRNRS